TERRASGTMRGRRTACADPRGRPRQSVSAATMDRKRTTVRYSRNVVDSCPVNKDGFRPRPWGRMHRMGHAKDAPLRADAQRNRERILEVAVAELTHSADTPLSVIAKKAGVGQGTLYR